MTLYYDQNCTLLSTYVVNIFWANLQMLMVGWKIWLVYVGQIFSQQGFASR